MAARGLARARGQAARGVGVGGGEGEGRCRGLREKERVPPHPPAGSTGPQDKEMPLHPHLGAKTCRAPLFGETPRPRPGRVTASTA